MKPNQMLELNHNWVDSRLNDNNADNQLPSSDVDPDILWIGCSESNFAPELITQSNTPILVHQNIANVLRPADPNGLAVLQYAIEDIGVSDIIVCGHYECDGVRTVFDNSELDYVDDWIFDIRRIKTLHDEELSQLDDDVKRINRLSKFNVKSQVKRLADTRIVKNAWSNETNISIHGWMYDGESGRLSDLECSVHSSEQLDG